MNLGRIFANAIARRVAYVLVAAALAWLGLGEARAEDYPSEGEAYAACMADASAAESLANFRDWLNRCTPSGTPVTSSYQCRLRTKSSSTSRTCRYLLGVGNPADAAYGWPNGKRCENLPGVTSEFNPKSGSIRCSAGCEYVWFRNADGTSTSQALGPVCDSSKFPTTCTGPYFWNPILNVCEPNTPDCPGDQELNSQGVCGPEVCPEGMSLKPDNTCGPSENECPVGQVKSPAGGCLPGEGQCAAGEARRPNGTCGKDSDGDGVADEDDENPENDPDKESASGGDSCNSPPSCSGSAIACMQVKIQWRIDCNTRRNRNVIGGACGSPPVCTGEKCDSMEYASLIQQWKTACALERMGSPGGGDNSDLIDLLTGPGTFDPNSVGGDGMGDNGPGGNGPGTGPDEGDGDEITPDRSGYGYGGSCPSSPSFTLPDGQTVQFDLTPLCNWVALAGNIVLVLAGLMCLRILSGVAT